MELPIYPLRTKWKLTYHARSNPKWRLEDFIEKCTISTINDLAGVYNFLQKLDMEHNDYNLMRNGINPIWEDPKTRNGTIISIQVPDEITNLVWTLMSFSIVGETFCQQSHLINGLSIKLIRDDGKKKQRVINPCSLIKIWTRSSSKDVRNGLQKFITEELPQYVPDKWKSHNYSIQSKAVSAEY